MGKPWGRLYGGTRNHRKIKLLREKFPSDWRSWYALIDLAIEVDDEGKIYVSPGIPYTMKELGKEIGIRREDTTNTFCTYLEQLGLITRTSYELTLNSFKERNYISDSSTPRVQKYREKRNPEKKLERFGNVSCNKDETHQNRTETEHNKEEPPISPLEGGVDGKKSLKPKKPKTTYLTEDFQISDRVREWAKKNNHGHLEAHREWFVNWAISNAKAKADWDRTFMNAISGNWAKIDISKPENNNGSGRPADKNCPKCHGKGMVMVNDTTGAICECRRTA